MPSYIQVDIPMSKLYLNEYHDQQHRIDIVRFTIKAHFHIIYIYFHLRWHIFRDNILDKYYCLGTR